MSDLVTHAAVLGRFQLTPGIQPVILDGSSAQYFVAHAYPDTIDDPKREINLDVRDCTVFTVTHEGQGDIDVGSIAVCEQVIERTVQAISEVVIWTKMQDLVGHVSAFARQIGRADVKYLLIEGSPDRVVAWKNPLFWAARPAAAMLAGFLGNMVVMNGPAANPTPAVVRRAMAVLDLINLGFYTEAFVTGFALVDDLSQEVVRAGMTKKGLAEDAQKGLLRSIKEERLKHFLANLTKLCDWESLADANSTLFDDLMKANARRNKIMHGSAKLSRADTLALVNTLLDVIDWLRTNPFGYAIDAFPLLMVAEGEFLEIQPVQTGESNAPSDA